MNNFLLDPALSPIADKVMADERLSFEDGMALYRSDDLHGVGRLADAVRRRKHGLTTYYNVNRHFNHTNICYADCKFCGFFVKHAQEGGYTHNIEESSKIARDAVPAGRDRAAHRRRAEHANFPSVLHRSALVAQARIPETASESLHDGRA